MKVLTAAQAQEKADELKAYAVELKADSKAKPNDIKEAEEAAAAAQAEADELAKKERESEASEETSTGLKIVASKELTEAKGAQVVKGHEKLFRAAAKQMISDLVSSERGKTPQEKAAKVNAGVPEVVIVSFAIDEKNKRASVVADCGNYGRRKAEVAYPVK